MVTADVQEAVMVSMASVVFSTFLFEGCGRARGGRVRVDRAAGKSERRARARARRRPDEGPVTWGGSLFRRSGARSLHRKGMTRLGFEPALISHGADALLDTLPSHN